MERKQLVERALTLQRAIIEWNRQLLPIDSNSISPRFVIWASDNNPDEQQRNKHLCYSVFADEKGEFQVSATGEDFSFFEELDVADRVSDEFHVKTEHGRLVWRIDTEYQYLKRLISRTITELDEIDSMIASGNE